jgi:hypothetical protein
MIQLPDFQNTALQRVTACGVIMLPARDESSWPTDKQERLEATGNAPDGRPFNLRLILNRQKKPDGLHVHLDAVRDLDRFDESPQINATIEEIARRIEGISSNEIRILGQVDFEVPRAEFPPDSAISLLLGIKFGQSNSPVRLSGSTYSVAEGPIQRIEWHLTDQGGAESIDVAIFSRFAFEMRDQFYSELVTQSTNAFERFILERFELAENKR